MIKIRPNKKAPTAIICESLPETNGIGIVSAKYNVIKELFTKKRVLNFFIYLLDSTYLGK